jgi:hypothetical protein
MEEYLAFVRKIGDTLDGQYIYEFLFTTVPDVVWGENFNIIPAGIIPNLMPEMNSLSIKGRVITDIEFKLACESTCFSMMDSIDRIISLCFTEAGIEKEFKFDFGEEFNVVRDRLKKYNLDLVEIEEIKFDEESIVDDVMTKLGGDDDDIESDVDDIF